MTKNRIIKVLVLVIILSISVRLVYRYYRTNQIYREYSQRIYNSGAKYILSRGLTDLRSIPCGIRFGDRNHILINI